MNTSFRSKLKGVLIVLFSIIIAPLIVNYSYDFWKGKKEEKEDYRLAVIAHEKKKQVHGTWTIETITRKSSIPDFENLKLYYRADLAVDNQSNITGTAFKVKEINKKGLISYNRASYTKADIIGTRSENEILMNWNILDKQNQLSMQIIHAKLSDQILYGVFTNDVGGQSGDFCARKAPEEGINTNDIIFFINERCKY